MISVLVPVYNNDVRKLAATLSAEAAQLPRPVEIVLLDDGSDHETLIINSEIAANKFVNYYQNDKNTGRISARERLASLAAYEWLIFLDDDSRIEESRFLEKYINGISDERTILVGGRVYDSARPLLCKYALHWKYGSEREGGWRKKAGNLEGFQSNNFLIHKSIFTALTFPPDLKGYGHEDTWMGMQMEDLGCRITHINNPLVHLGLQTAEQFIEKSEIALLNLHLISKRCAKRKLCRHAKIYRRYLQLKRTGMLPVVSVLYQAFKKRIWNNLHSCHPTLRLFDLYRLNYFIKIVR